MRHTICTAPAGKTEAAPASCARRVGQAAATGALVALGGITLRGVAGLARARRSAVPLATVAVAAQQDLGAATCAQEQAGGTVHAHPGQTEVLDGRAPARHTVVAPPSSARCRARRGRQASRPERPLPCPPSSASGKVVSRPRSRSRTAYAPWPLQSETMLAAREHATSTARRQRRLACLAALQGDQAGEQRSAEQGAQLSVGASHADPGNQQPRPHRRISAVPGHR